jgi:hypothetical protein
MVAPQLKKFPRGVKTKQNSPAGGGEKAKVGAGSGAGAFDGSTRYDGGGVGECYQAVSRDEGA